MRKKILIGYTEYAIGDKSAALCIKKYFDEKDEFEVMLVNLSLYSKYSTHFYNNIFNFINKHERLSKFVYGLADNKVIGKLNRRFSIKSCDNSKLRDLLINFNPDLIIATHFYVSYIAGFYNSLGIIDCKIMTVITNFSHHEWWTVNKDEIDYYVVANEMVKEDLIQNKIDENKIFTFGIPIDKNLISNLQDRDFILKKYSIKDDKPIYLFFAGGSVGYDYVFDYFKAVVKKRYPINLIFICGNNKNLKAKCEDYLLKNDIRNVIVLGFTKDVFNIMSISDLVITKPGVNTLNECIEMKKPCILIPGIKAQENYNAKFMTKKHYAIKVRGANYLAYKVKLSLEYPFIINSMKNKLSMNNERDSCKKIYELILDNFSKK